MSHIPSSAMKHAHAAPEPAPAAPRARATDGAEPRATPVWVSVAAGVAGAVGTALVLSLRSSAPAKPRKKAGRKAKAA